MLILCVYAVRNTSPSRVGISVTLICCCNHVQSHYVLQKWPGIIQNKDLWYKADTYFELALIDCSQGLDPKTKGRYLVVSEVLILEKSQDIYS